MKKLLTALLVLLLCACPPPETGGEPGTVIEIVRTTEISQRHSQQSAIVVVEMANGRRVEYPIWDVNVVDTSGLKVGQQVLCTPHTVRLVTGREVAPEK